MRPLESVTIPIIALVIIVLTGAALNGAVRHSAAVNPQRIACVARGGVYYQAYGNPLCLDPSAIR